MIRLMPVLTVCVCEIFAHTPALDQIGVQRPISCYFFEGPSCAKESFTLTVGQTEVTEFDANQASVQAPRAPSIRSSSTVVPITVSGIDGYHDHDSGPRSARLRTGLQGPMRIMPVFGAARAKAQFIPTSNPDYDWRE